MPIRYIPNDPGDTMLQSRNVAALPDRPASSVRFFADGLPPQDLYQPGTAEFAAWQSRQAALTALDVFEGICGALPGWMGVGANKTMPVIADAGEDLNAYYNRDSISFFHAQAAGRAILSGASTDVVAHEAGHAILDAIRPDLWGVTMIEVAAFHEGIGDVIAVMTALSDREARTALLAGGAGISRANFVETTAEELSRAIGVLYPGHNASEPRHAFNNFRWALPQDLPQDGGPGEFIAEAHSLGQLVSGVYYDLIANLFAAGAAQTEAALWSACQTATRLVVSAARQAPVRPRFFETWGRSMMVIDHDSGGANAAQIRSAFANHGITVGTTGFLTPQLSFGNVGLKTASAGAGMLTAAAKQRLRELLGVTPGTPLAVRRADVGDQEIAEVATNQKVDLSGIAEALTGVVAQVPRPAMVGAAATGLSLLGAVNTDGIYASEVRDFVAGLVKKSAIDFGGNAAGGAGFLGLDNVITHKIVKRGDERVLTRVAFACGCGCRSRA